MYQVIYKSGETEKEIYLEDIQKIFFIFGITQSEFNNYYYNIRPAKEESIIQKINIVPVDKAPKKKIEVVFA